MSAIHHRRAVCMLYRKSLQHARSWVVDASAYRIEAVGIRKRFDIGAKEKNFLKARQILIDGQAEFKRESHPDKYKPCVALDGTKWERNIHPPAETVQMTPEEESWYNDKGSWA